MEDATRDKIMKSPKLKKLYESAKRMRKAKLRMETLAQLLAAWPTKVKEGGAG